MRMCGKSSPDATGLNRCRRVNGVWQVEKNSIPYMMYEMKLGYGPEGGGYWILGLGSWSEDIYIVTMALTAVPRLLKIYGVTVYV